jgi:xanthine dehydrogenase YagT iron-sulfur-binding subunit
MASRHLLAPDTLAPLTLDADRPEERFLVPVSLQVNGEPFELELEPWTTLLDLLRERLHLTGTKKGCDHGQCGACTVLIDGKRANACLALAVIHDGASIVTVEGLASLRFDDDGPTSASGVATHAVSRAATHTPHGTLSKAPPGTTSSPAPAPSMPVGARNALHPIQQAFIEHDAFQCGYCTPGQLCSAVGLLQEGHAHSKRDIREQMSGNICRCGAYTQIVDAIADVAGIDSNSDAPSATPPSGARR